MKFTILVYHGTTPLPGSDAWKQLSAAEQKAIYADYAAVSKAPGVAPSIPLGLAGAAKTVQVRDGRPVVKSGPYSEGVGGVFVYEAETMEAAVELASRIPAARLGGAVEIRAAEQYW
jgi:hypothetical protein